MLNKTFPEEISAEVMKIEERCPQHSARDVEFPISCAIMAAGISRRFQGSMGDNKLLVEFKGKPLLQWTLECFAKLSCHSKIVVVRKREVGNLISQNSFQVVWNKDKNLSPTVTIRKAILSLPDDSTGCLFAVGDQPFLTYSSIRKLCEAFQSNPNKIVSLSRNQERGNPVIFPRSLFPELLALEDGLTGKSVINCHPELLMLVEATCPEELMDIDTHQQYADACNGIFFT